uniref:Uncharacterized protein n=1 Tax=Mus musculus TaxID=10090 RepID=Q8BMZ4_MOUSE|nr:unnamed protein product [Mus musculus]
MLPNRKGPLPIDTNGKRWNALRPFAANSANDRKAKKREVVRPGRMDAYVELRFKANSKLGTTPMRGCPSHKARKKRKRQTLPTSMSLYRLPAEGMAQTRGTFSHLKIRIKGRPANFKLSKNPSQVCPPLLDFSSIQMESS